MSFEKQKQTNSSKFCNELIVWACAVRSSRIFCVWDNCSEWIVPDGDDDDDDCFRDWGLRLFDPGVVVVVKYGISVGKACRDLNSANSRLSKTTCCKTFS
jgi:hypothetical protein